MSRLAALSRLPYVAAVSLAEDVRSELDGLAWAHCQRSRTRDTLIIEQSPPAAELGL
jgi:hypothetical protein